MGASSAVVGTSPEWFQAVIEAFADMVIAIDESGTICYANPAVEHWLGLAPHQVLGTNASAYVHPDDLDRALGSIAYNLANDEATTPAPFRLLAGDGQVLTFDFMALPTHHHPRIGASVFVAREASSQEVVDGVLEALVTGSSIEEVLVQAAELMRRPLWEVECAIYFQDDDGGERLVHTGVPHPLVADPDDPDGPDGPDDCDDPESPWERARRLDRRVCVDADHLPEPWAGRAAEAGMHSCWCEPIADPMNGRPACLVMWSPLDVTPELGQGRTFERTARLMSLALLQRDQQVQLVRAARHDRLTGLPNRARFLFQLDRALEERPDPDELVVLYIDLDHFKPVNDGHGHAAGDAALVAVAGRIRSVAPAGASVARIGGDEFAVAAPVPDDAAARALADRLIAELSRPIPIGSNVTQVSASVGVVRAHRQGSTGEDLLEAADRAMYQAKQAGRGRSHLG